MYEEYNFSFGDSHWKQTNKRTNKPSAMDKNTKMKTQTSIRSYEKCILQFYESNVLPVPRKFAHETPLRYRVLTLRYSFRNEFKKVLTQPWFSSCIRHSKFIHGEDEGSILRENVSYK